MNQKEMDDYLKVSDPTDVERTKFDPDWMKDPEIMKEIIREQMIEYGQVISEQAEKIKRYEKALCALLNMACEATADGMIDIITDTLQGFELMEQYEEDALEGTYVLAQFISE